MEENPKNISVHICICTFSFSATGSFSFQDMAKWHTWAHVCVFVCLSVCVFVHYLLFVCIRFVFISGHGQNGIHGVCACLSLSSSCQFHQGWLLLVCLIKCHISLTINTIIIIIGIKKIHTNERGNKEICDHY